MMVTEWIILAKNWKSEQMLTGSVWQGKIYIETKIFRESLNKCTFVEIFYLSTETFILNFILELIFIKAESAIGSKKCDDNLRLQWRNPLILSILFLSHIHNTSLLYQGNCSEFVVIHAFRAMNWHYFWSTPDEMRSV